MSKQDETAWLVEYNVHNYHPRWWGFNSPGKYAEWYSDSNRAIRFSRKEDAERMRLYIIENSSLKGDKLYESQITVTEHMRLEPVVAAPVQQEEMSMNDHTLILLKKCQVALEQWVCDFWSKHDEDAIKLIAELQNALPHPIHQDITDNHNKSQQEQECDHGECFGGKCIHKQPAQEPSDFEGGENPSNKVLYLTMAKHGLNLVVGEDMQHLLGYGRDVWRKALESAQPAQQEPAEWLTGCPECGMNQCDCDSGTVHEPVPQLGDGVYHCDVCRSIVDQPDHSSPSDRDVWCKGTAKWVQGPFYTERLAQPAQQEPERKAWEPYLSDRADGVKGSYAIARWNPKGYREVWNLWSHRWASASDDVLTLEEAQALMKQATFPSEALGKSPITTVNRDRSKK